MAKAPPWRSASAVISEDGLYRYELWRTLGDTLLGSKGTVVFCMLNPSRADATTDDPTIRRCLGYARSWGYGKLAVVNLYPYRATKPAELNAWTRRASLQGAYHEAVMVNSYHVAEVAQQADMLVAAWGQHGHGTPPAVLYLKRYNWHALGLTKAGAPVHPLYQLASARPRLMVLERQWALV